MVTSLEQEFPTLKRHVKHELCPDVCNYLAMFDDEKNILVSSLVQNFLSPTSEAELQFIDQEFGSEIANNLKKLNRLYACEEGISPMDSEFRSVVILFLINYIFYFNHREKYPEFEPLLTQPKIYYVLKQLEQIDISEIRSELEDRLFGELEPETYNNYLGLLQFTRDSYRAKELEIRTKIEELLSQSGISFEIHSRTKSLYSMHKKILKKKILLSQVLDTIGLRIIVDSDRECYLAMGLILSNWHVMRNKVKDYIALPKANGYQSIHLTLIDNEHPVEIQIRSFQMHQFAQYGSASHHLYKKNGK